MRNIIDYKLIVKHLFLLITIVISLNACQQNNDQTQERQLIENLIKAVANDDFKAYENSLATNEEIIENVKSIGPKDDPFSDQLIQKEVLLPWSKNKIDGFKLFKEQGTDWNKVSIDSVIIEPIKILDHETGTLTFYYTSEGKSCSIEYKSYLRNKKGAIKINNSPHFLGCK